MDSKQAIFKTILGEMLKTEYEDLSPTQVVEVAIGAVQSFAKQNGVFVADYNQTKVVQEIDKLFTNNSDYNKGVQDALNILKKND